MATTLYQGWDFSIIGTAQIAWTDDAGAHNTGSVFASGRYSHIDLSGVLPNADFSGFAATLQAVMDALTSETITVTFSAATRKYTLESTGAVFEVTWSGPAQTIMRRILGFSGNLSGATSYTSNVVPIYLKIPQHDARSEYIRPRAVSGQRSTRRLGDKTIAVLGPVTISQDATWEHQFEPKIACQSRHGAAGTTPGDAPWTWEDFWEHGRTYAFPCAIVDGGDDQVFQILSEWDESAFRTLDSRADFHFIIRVTAAIIGYL